MGSNRWRLHRAGLINFWYYDDEEFHFSDGKLLLRGSNGSGKSVTMQSLIPLLLDGNKSPERLDPFGSKARKLENYLLDEEETDKDENTAYLYMEFKKEESENYLTIGMGFKAQKGKSLKSWGFAITDGRRIGHNFYLYKDMGEKIPLTKRELENRIETGGFVKDGQGEYMKMVNDLLFGFDEIEEYDELIKLLVQLRTPKLSKDFKPTVVYEIMENSLQQLSEEDLRPMSEAIENMDNIKSRLEELKESKKSAEKIKESYDKYNRYVLYDKAKSYITAAEEYEKVLQEKKAIEEKRDASREEYQDATRQIEALRIKQTVVEEKKKQLDIHDSVKIRERISEVEKNIEEADKDRQDKTQRLETKKGRERLLYGKIMDYRSQEVALIQKVRQILEDMDTLASAFAFDEQSFMKAELLKDLKKRYKFDFIRNDLKVHNQKLETGKQMLQTQERKAKEYDKILCSLDIAKEEMRFREKKLEEAESLLGETKEELIEKIYTWKKGNRELLLSDEALVRISRTIHSFTDKSSIDEVLSVVRETLNDTASKYQKDLSGQQFVLEKLEGFRQELLNQIHELKNKKDMAPERDEKVIANRARLSKYNIPHLPLYKAIDFRPEVPHEMRGRIEEALNDMGLLDALIIPKRYQQEALSMDPEAGDKYIFPVPSLLAHDLTEMLMPDGVEIEGISAAEIEEALRSILIDAGGSNVYIDEKGYYGIGILKGKAGSSYIPKFIGTTARMNYRQERIQALQQELWEVEDKIREAQKKIEELRGKIEKLKEEYSSFPSDQDLQIALHERKDADFNLQKAKEKVLEREEEEKKSYTELKELNQQVYALTHKILLKPDLGVYIEAVEAAGEYREQLYELTQLHENILRNKESEKNLEAERETLEIDIENLSGDLHQISMKLSKLKANREDLQAQLELSNYEEIQKEIEACLQWLRDIPGLLEKEIIRATTHQNGFEGALRELSKLEEQIEIKQKSLKLYQEIFTEEFTLNLLNLQDLGEALKNAHLVLREIKLQDRLEKEDCIQGLYGKFTENTQYLREYLLRIDHIFERNLEEEREIFSGILLKAKRLFLVGKIRGKDVEFYKLIEFIQEGIEESERLLRESDRQLFEDILVKNISKKIRAKIYHSDMWVNRMNELMEKMNTSSGLSFSLKWTSKKAESEDQLDTKELVDLLKQEGNLMKESDLNRLSEHFRSKIAEARRLQEDLGKSQSFHSIMREILDYRKWFEFKLYFMKTGQNKKELTNNAFYQLSGGEKAMAMYVPLFSAVYARYAGARKDCPRIISLDEAFAGVDEKNIRDMFRLLNELHLDFVINSQILWGDYDTVPSLSISELIRPDNVNFVTVIRYHWNGRTKELVS